jgi:acetylglutamate/LysW-gamma-L-alpha-aminoadipate kinase
MTGEERPPEGGQNVLIVKAGGGRNINWDGLAADLAEARARSGIVLIHGANAVRNALAERLGVPVKRVVSPSGIPRVYTDREASTSF